MIQGLLTLFISCISKPYSLVQFREWIFRENKSARYDLERDNRKRHQIISKRAEISRTAVQKVFRPGSESPETHPMQPVFSYEPVFCSPFVPLGVRDQASGLFPRTRGYYIFVSDHAGTHTRKKNGEWWAFSSRDTSTGFINNMFSQTPAAASEHRQTNFLLRRSKATANLHIHLMLFKKISDFLIFYLVSPPFLPPPPPSPALSQAPSQRAWWLDTGLKILIINLHHDKLWKCRISFLFFSPLSLFSLRTS